MTRPEDWPVSALPVAGTLSERSIPCQHCGKATKVGETVWGSREPFGADPPHFIHWVSCTERGAVSKDFKR